MTPVRMLYLEDSEADAELVQALLDESRMACTHPQLDFIAKIAESSTGYSVVGKANSSNLHMAVDARLGKKVKARGRP